MSSKEQVLKIEPATELRFKGPFTEVVTAELKLTNPSDKRVCFKVKTTAPKRYCVRPNSGIIESKEGVVVSVMLQPFEYDPQEKNKHKFMVQTMYAPAGKLESTEALWKDAKPDQLMDSKLKCVFEMPGFPRPSVVPEGFEVKEDKKQETSLSSEPKPVASPAKPSQPSSSTEELEIVRLMNEVSELKKENTTLKENDVRLRKVAMSNTTSSTPEKAEQQQSATYLPYMYIIVALIVGVIIGKLVL